MGPQPSDASPSIQTFAPLLSDRGRIPSRTCRRALSRGLPNTMWRYVRRRSAIVWQSQGTGRAPRGKNRKISWPSMDVQILPACRSHCGLRRLKAPAANRLARHWEPVPARKEVAATLAALCDAGLPKPLNARNAMTPTASRPPTTIAVRYLLGSFCDIPAASLRTTPGISGMVDWKRTPGTSGPPGRTDSLVTVFLTGMSGFVGGAVMTSSS